MPITSLFREVVFFDFAVQRAKADPQGHGGLGSVAAGALKRAADRLKFDLLYRHPRFNDGLRFGAVGDVRREIADFIDRTIMPSSVIRSSRTLPGHE